MISAGRPGCMVPHAIAEVESETNSNLESGSYVSMKMKSTACEVQLQSFRLIVAYDLQDAQCMMHA